MSEKSQGLINVRDELFQTYQEELNIPIGTIIRAGEILDEAHDEGLTRSRCYRTVIAAIVLLACRENNIPRVSDDFAAVTRKNDDTLDPKDIGKESRKIKRELGLHITPTSADAYLDYYADELNVSDETRSKAKELLNYAEEQGISKGPAPTSLAAGALDAARRLTDDDIVQTDIANVSHVSIAQFREYCQELQQPAESTA